MREERSQSMDMPAPAASSVSWNLRGGAVAMKAAPDAEQPPANADTKARRGRHARRSSMGFGGGAHTQNGTVATKNYRSVTAAHASGSTQGTRMQRTWTMNMGTTFGNQGKRGSGGAADAERAVVVLRGEAIPGLVQEPSNGNIARHRCARSSSMGFGRGARTQNGTVATKSYKSVTATHASGSIQGRVQRSWTMSMATTFGNQGKKAQAAASVSHISAGARQSISIPSEPMTFEQRDKIMSKVALNRKQVHDHVMSCSPEEWKEMQAKLRQTKARTNAGLAMAMDCHLLDAALEQSKNRRRHKEQQNIMNDTSEVVDDDDKKENTENASFEKQETVSTSITAVAAGQATPGISACGILPSHNAPVSSTLKTGDPAPYALHLVRSNSLRFGLVSQSLLHDLRRASFTEESDKNKTSTTTSGNTITYSLLQRLNIRSRSCHMVVEARANTKDVKKPPPSVVPESNPRRWFSKRRNVGDRGRGARTASPQHQTVDEDEEQDDP
jgi:hypothetical protein